MYDHGILCTDASHHPLPSPWQCSPPTHIASGYKAPFPVVKLFSEETLDSSTTSQCPVSLWRVLKYWLSSVPPNEKRSSWSDALAAAYVPGDGASPVTGLCSHDSEYGSKISTMEHKCCLLFSEKSSVRPPCTTTLLPTRLEMCQNLGSGSYLEGASLNLERAMQWLTIFPLPHPHSEKCSIT